MISHLRSLLFLLLVGISWPGLAQKISFNDPTGDDKGPGSYVYPTDVVYKKGSFDLTAASFEKSNSKLDIKITVNSILEDPWRYGTGFSVQMIFIFIDTDQKEGSGFTDVPPGLNIQFAKKNAWDKCIILSPQTPQRVKSEVAAKVSAAMQPAILIPARTKGAGKNITASVDWPADIDLSRCAFQVVMQANEGFPSGKNLLTQIVNEYEGQHRFGGGSDMDCDPHVLDILAGDASGAEDEKNQQYKLLQYECAEDGTVKKIAVIGMVKSKS